MTQDQEIAELKLQLRSMTDRYEMFNRMVKSFTEDRALIARQLYAFGFYLDSDGVMHKLENYDRTNLRDSAA